MSYRWIARAAAVALVAAPIAAAGRLTLEQEWKRPDWERRPLEKVVVLAIAHDVAARKNFENKFVSHLRGRGIEAAVSYEAAPDLTALPSRGQVTEFLANEGIDAAISVRLVPLEDDDVEAWARDWLATASGNQTLKELIEQSLPIDAKRSSHYGVEVSLWDADKRLRLWSGRTRAHGIKELRKGDADLVQLAIDALKREGLL